jgi:hypothetical protein
MKFIMPLLVLLALGCSSSKPFYDTPTCGQPNVTRCATTYKVEMCGTNGHWMTVMDCFAIGSNWVCDLNDPNNSCIRKKP